MNREEGRANSYVVPCGTDSEQTYAQRAGLYEERELPLALPISENYQETAFPAGDSAGRSVTGVHRGFEGRGTVFAK